MNKTLGIDPKNMNNNMNNNTNNNMNTKKQIKYLIIALSFT